MISGSLETVLISNPVDGDKSAIGGGVGVRSTLDGTDLIGFGSDLFLASGGFNFDSIFALKAVLKKCY